MAEWLGTPKGNRFTAGYKPASATSGDIMIDLTTLFQQYESNILHFPSILKVLSDKLGVSCVSLKAIGAGYDPINKAWIIPERNAKGEIIGLMRRYHNGDKSMVKGSKRGLIYALNYDYDGEAKKYVGGPENWIRVSPDGYSCPLCGKHDGCLLPRNNPNNPPAVVCVHISEGAIKPLGLGYLHILQPEQNICTNLTSILTPSQLPVIVVEGHSDVGIAMDLGFTAVGRFSATGGAIFLKLLLKNKNVIIVGENDPTEVGKDSMESFFITLKPVCKSIKKLLPPAEFKDLRDWKIRDNLTQELFLDYIDSIANDISDPNIFDSDMASGIAKRFIGEYKTKKGHLILRNYKGEWLLYKDGCYNLINTEQFRGQLYRFLEKKKYYRQTSKGNVVIELYKPTRSKVTDIIDALNQYCPIIDDPPIWITKRKHPHLFNTMAFKNGILDVQKYVEGKIKLYKPTPEFFSLYVFPYNFDENLESKLWEDFLEDIFNNDKNKIALLAQWFGYNSVPDMSYEKLMLFTGIPRSGKSTVLETMQSMLGENQCCSTSFQSLSGPFGYQPLLGKLAALIGDAKTPKFNETTSVLEKILHITGGDAVSINRKRINELPSIHLTTRFTIAMNDLPVFTDHSRALEARLLTLLFEKSYLGKEDRSLKLRLKNEAKQGKLINFTLRGLKDLRLKKDFIIPPSSLQTLEQFSRLSSPVLSFISDCCEISPSENDRWLAPKDQIYDIWKVWCKEQGRYHGVKEQFGRWLRAACPKIISSRMRLSGDLTQVYCNIRLTPYAIKKYLGE